MSENKIRCSSLGIIRKGNKILVFEAYDEIKEEKFYRPLGGGIEFGERSYEALEREFMEEMNLAIRVNKFVSVFENIFTFNGKDGHQNMFAYECGFIDKSQYDKDEFICYEDGGQEFKALWINIDDIKSKKVICYPSGIEDIL